MSTSEQELRLEAIRRRLSGESREHICQDLQRSRRWFSKWWAEFRDNPHSQLADHSGARLKGSPVISPELEEMVVGLRKTFEGASYGLIGARSIRFRLLDLKVRPLPSESTIQRILARHGLTHPLGAGAEGAYYPWLVAWQANAIMATDIITRHLKGGLEIQNFHTMDLFTQAAYLSQHLDKTTDTACAHLLGSWEKLGIPWIHQFDNEGSFCGGHTHPNVIGRMVRLCLWCGVEAIFTPVYEPKRNHQIETFHGLWCKGCWNRQTFTSFSHLEAEVPNFTRWYHCEYRPPELGGKTPEQMLDGLKLRKLTPDLRRHMPDLDKRLPLTKGRFHIMRRVDSSGQVRFLNQSWQVGANLIGHYVRATINTAHKSLTFLHKPSDQHNWQLIQNYSFPIDEPVHDLLPSFRQNSARCVDCLPG